MKPELIEIVANGERKQLAPCSVADFLAGSGWKPTQVVVERNGEVLSRDRLSNEQLAHGDRLEIIVPVAGG